MFALSAVSQGIRRAAAGVAGAIAFSAAAYGQVNDPVAIAPEDLSFFIEESYSDFFPEGSDANTQIDKMTPGLEDYLYSSALIPVSEDEFLPASPEDVVPAFARKIGVDEATASRYAQVLIQGVRRRAECSRRPECAFDAELFRNLEATALTEPTGELLIAVGQNVGSAIIGIATEHPEGETILLALYEYTRDFDYLAPLLATPRPSAKALASCIGDSFAEFQPAELLALLEVAIQRTADAPDSALHTIAEAALIYQLAVQGLNAEALDVYDALSDAERAQLRDRSSAIYSGDEGNGLPQSDSGPDPRFRSTATYLAAVLIEAGRSDEAVPIIAATAEADEEPDASQRRPSLLQELADPTLSDDEIFDAFLFGYPDGETPPAWVDDLVSFSGFSGLLGQAVGSPALKIATVDYLRARGQEDMARYVLAARRVDPYGDIGSLPSNVVARLGDGFAASTERYRHLMAAADEDFAARRHPADDDASLASWIAEDRPVPFVERELPAEFREPPPIPREEPDLSSIGVDPYFIVRAERSGSAWAVVYLNHALDPAGEVSGGGYWFVRSRDGENWDEPVYLGLQQFFPYEVAPQSALPMLDGDRLQIEVAIREIDRESISFPPIGLQASRIEDGLYLDFDWDALVSDQDRDGLSDLVEHRMGLSAYNADSDGDGDEDGLDSLPNVAFAPSEETYELGLELVQQLYGYERGALIVGAPAAAGGAAETPSMEEMFAAAMGQPLTRIAPDATLFLEGDPRLFSSLRLPFRLIVLSSDHVDRLSSEYGVFYPAGARWMFSDSTGDRLYVIWDASWVGGSFLIRKTDEGYEVMVLSSWIT